MKSCLINTRVEFSGICIYTKIQGVEVDCAQYV